MGADIQWIIERQHQDGAWEAVASKHRLRSIHGAALSNLSWNDPRVFFGERDYGWFGLLSDVRGRFTAQHGTIAISGLPADASEHTRLALGEKDDPFSGYHSHGHFTLERLRTIVSTPDRKILSTQEALDLAGLYLECLTTLISGRPSIDTETLLIGEREDDETGEAYPAYRQESNHARLARIERQKGLLPVGGETLRVIVAYDS